MNASLKNQLTTAVIGEAQVDIGGRGFVFFLLEGNFTLLKFNSSKLKIGGGPKRKQSYSTHPFSGAKMLVSGMIETFFG